jgi:hypothetical protein
MITHTPTTLLAALFLLLLPIMALSDETTPRATYIANMGAMIERADTKIVFDPLFY